MKITYYDNTGNVSEVKDFGEMVDSRVMEYSPECEVFNISDEEFRELIRLSHSTDSDVFYRIIFLRALLHVDCQNYCESKYNVDEFCAETSNIFSSKDIGNFCMFSLNRVGIETLYHFVFGIYCCRDLAEWMKKAFDLFKCVYVLEGLVRNPEKYNDLEIHDDAREAIDNLFSCPKFDFDVLTTIKLLGESNRGLIYSLISALEPLYSKLCGGKHIFESVKDSANYPLDESNTKDIEDKEMHPMTIDFCVQEIATLRFDGDEASEGLRLEVLNGLQTEYKQFCDRNANWIEKTLTQIIAQAETYIEKVERLTTEDWSKFYFLHYRKEMNVEYSFYTAIVHDYDIPHEFLNFNKDSLLFLHLLELEVKGKLQDDRLELYKEMVKINFIKEKMGVVKGQEMRPLYDDLLNLSMAKVDDIKDSFTKPYKSTKIYDKQEVIKCDDEEIVLSTDKKDAIARAILFLDPLFTTDRFINEKCWPYGGAKLRKHIYDLLREYFSGRILDEPDIWGFNLKLIYNIIGVLACQKLDKKYYILQDSKGAKYSDELEKGKNIPENKRIKSRPQYINQCIIDSGNKAKNYSCLNDTDKKNIEGFFAKAIDSEEDILFREREKQKQERQ